MRKIATIILFGIATSLTAQAETNACSSLVVVELKLNNVWSQNVPNGAFIHDSVYVGVSTSAEEASANAISACKEGKYSEQKCRSATQTVYTGTDQKYNEVAKALSGCRDGQS